MELHGAKAHYEFDLASATALYASHATDLSGEMITSPYHLYAVERLRDQHALRRGRSVPTDVFVFGQGEAPSRCTTRYGGLPYWLARRRWPTDPDGARFQFLGQLCFQDSLDLFDDLPGDLLSVFVPAGDQWEWDWVFEPETIHFEWLTINDKPLIEHLPKGVEPLQDTEFYGVLHRGYDYPDATVPAARLDCDCSYWLPFYAGTKIGGLPSRLEYGMDDDELRADPLQDAPGRFLGQLASVQARAKVPFPWTNREQPLAGSSAPDGIYADENQVLFSDMGILFLYLTDDGGVTAEFAGG